MMRDSQHKKTKQGGWRLAGRLRGGQSRALLLSCTLAGLGVAGLAWAEAEKPSAKEKAAVSAERKPTETIQPVEPPVAVQLKPNAAAQPPARTGQESEKLKLTTTRAQVQGEDSLTSAVEAYRRAQEALRNAERQAPDSAKKNSEKLQANTEADKVAIPLTGDRLTEVERLKIREKAEEELKRARQALLELRRAQTAWKPTQEERAQVVAKLEEVQKKRLEDREERAKQTRAEVEKTHGKLIERPEVQEAMKRHAWRVARLQQLILLAEASEQKDALTRAQQLLEKEKENHAEEMKNLQVQAAPGGAK